MIDDATKKAIAVRESVFLNTGTAARLYQAQISPRGFTDTRRMIVRQDAGGGLYDFTRMNAGPVDGPAKEFFEAEDAVTIIQPETNTSCSR